MLEADLALYRAKADGGDSIGVADRDCPAARVALRASALRDDRAAVDDRVHRAEPVL